MEPIQHLLHFGSHLDLGREMPGRLHVVQARGRAVELDVPAGWTSVWWSVRGEPMLAADNREWVLPPRHLQVWRDLPVHARSLSTNGWLVACARQDVWDSAAPWIPPLFPWRGRQSRSTTGLLVRMARGRAPAGMRDISSPAALLPALLANLADRQASLRDLLPRCNGRSAARRRQSLMRMLRVRHSIECNLDVRLDLDSLAATANYSPCHLIRAFRAVFGETPSAYGARLRAERAWRLVCDTRMPVCEITEALGFESQSAFCRAFKNVHGMTTSEVRRLHAGDAPASRAA